MFDFGILSGILGAAGSVVSSIIQRDAQAAQTAAQNQNSRRMLKQQNKYNTAAAKKQVEYDRAAAARQAKYDRQTAARQNKNSKKAAAQQFVYDQKAAKQQYAYNQKAAAQQHAYDMEALQFSVDNPTTVYSAVDYKKMVADAEAAGFNPLTALRNGGSAGFSSSTSPGPVLSRQASTMQASTMQAPALQTYGRQSSTRQAVAQQAPLDQAYVGAIDFGDAIAQIGSAIAGFDPHAQGQREAEIRLVEAQIANLNASTDRMRFGEVPSYTAGTRGRQLGSGVGHGQTFRKMADALPPDAAYPQTPTVEAPTLTNPFPRDSGLVVDTNIPDVQTAAGNRYGEPGEWVGGVLTFGADAWANVKRMAGDHWLAIGNEIEAARAHRPALSKPKGDPRAIPSEYWRTRQRDPLTIW